MSGATTWWANDAEDVTLHVWRLEWWQNDDLVEDSFLFVEGAVAFAGGIWWAIHAGSLRQAIAGLLVAGFFGAFAYVSAVRIWRARTGVSIRVTGSRVVIRDRELSDEPLEIPRGQILAVQVDASIPERRRFLQRGKRPHRQPEGAAGIFGGKAGRSVQALRLGTIKPRANLAILLHTPVKHDADHRLDALPFPARFRGWSAWCILATIEDPDAARQAFEQWGAVREITDRDLVGRGSSAQDRRRAPWGVAAYLLVGIGGLILLGILVGR